MSISTRRDFVRLAASAAALSTLPAPARLLAQGIDLSRLDKPDVSPMPRAEVETLLRAHFRCEDPGLWQLAVDAYHQCVLGKVHPPEPPFQHPWVAPGGIYVGQWLWDTTFVCDLLAILPDQRDVIRGVYQNYWDFQKRWDAAMPEYRHGMIANFIAPDSMGGRKWREFPTYAQAPLLAWGIERVIRRNGDLELARAALAPLEAFHEWYWRERDLLGVGLVCVGCYDGDAQHARYETYDNEVDLDAMRMTAHPSRHGDLEGPWYGDILIPCNTAYLLQSELSLARLAARLGDTAMSQRRRARYAKGRRGMQRYMWDVQSGCYLAVQRGTLEKIHTQTVGGLAPLIAGVPTHRQAHRMAQAIQGPEWMTPLPLPSVSSHDANYRPDGFWRGDVWPPTVFQVASGLAAYGESALASVLADKLITNAIKAGISERYHSQTGAALGVRGLGMSSVMLTLALERLSTKYKITVI